MEGDGQARRSTDAVQGVQGGDTPSACVCARGWSRVSGRMLMLARKWHVAARRGVGKVVVAGLQQGDGLGGSAPIEGWAMVVVPAWLGNGNALWHRGVGVGCRMALPGAAGGRRVHG